jgi:hypothetical protein
VRAWLFGLDREREWQQQETLELGERTLSSNFYPIESHLLEKSLEYELVTDDGWAVALRTLRKILPQDQTLEVDFFRALTYSSACSKNK